MDDEAAFETFFAVANPRLLAMLIRFHGFEEQVAQDAAAEAMTRLVPLWTKVEHPAAWVRVTAFRVACRLVKGGHLALPELELVDGQAETEFDAVVLALAAGAAIDNLPPRQQEVMTLALADLTPTETAEVLGCTPEQARANLAHARRALRRALGTEEEA
ncbi:sigma-70 family RNA polymerase sigma factor [Streptomyces cyaneofuscatus]|uniref:sigma-70 family RNA polymerase sigma factor n=1 Tax=Streptomyces cyaneofuscatus TaxID=66883 RepID=UPI0034165CC1